jgi:hypothetical protein
MGSLHPQPEPPPPAVYEIRVAGHLGPDWGDWFPGLTVTPQEGGDTLLTGPVADQAALHGLLRKVRDLGAPLISVNRLAPGERAEQSVATEQTPLTKESR